MRVLGIDVGSKKDGHSLLERTGRAWTRLGGGVVPHGTPLDLAGVDLVVIEEPSQVMPSRRMDTAGTRAAIGMANHLLKSKDAAREVELVAMRAGVPVVRLTSSNARRAIGIRIGGRGARKGGVDKQIAIAVPRIVSGWPARSTTHERDAAVAAIAGLAMWEAENAFERRVERSVTT